MTVKGLNDVTIPHLAEAIFNAIAAQEGWFFPGSSSISASRAQENNNPGNLRGAPWLSPPVAMQAGYWLATSVYEGMAGALHLVALRIAEGWSLRRLLNSWAPAADGNAPDTYIQNVMAWTGILNADLALMYYLAPPVDPRK